MFVLTATCQGGRKTLIENTLFGVRDKVKIAIDRIRQFEPPEGYYVAFSGGKDSLVVKDLVKRSGVKAEFNFNRSMEPPEVIYYIRQQHPDVITHLPKHSMWELIIKHGMPPTQIIRYCCQEMKENDVTAKGRFVVTGVRWAESVRRSKRRMTETCTTDNSKRYLHPIIDWQEDDVWEYIRTNKLPYCSLYDEGQTRIGCVMCPMKNKQGMLQDAQRWPKIAQMYKWACNKAHENNVLIDRKTMWDSGEDMYNWWIYRRPIEKVDPDQTVMFE